MPPQDNVLTHCCLVVHMQKSMIPVWLGAWFNTMPIPEPALIHCELDQQKQTAVNCEFRYEIFFEEYEF